MRKNIKDLGILINNLDNDSDTAYYKANNDLYTSGSLSLDEANAEKTDCVNIAFKELQEFTDKIAYVKSVRNNLNMTTIGVFKDKEYRLIDLIELLKLKQGEQNRLLSLFSASSKDVKISFNSQLGKSVYKVLNGDMNILSSRLTEIKNEIDELQSIIDTLNLTTYVDIDI